MSLRSKSLKISASLIAIISIVFAFSYSNAESLLENTQLKNDAYKPVASQFKVSTGEKIEVAELFWFGCGHCFALEPAIKSWKKNMPSNARFVKVPAIFSSRWEFHGKAFYTMQSLNVPEEAYDAMFQSIHVKRRQINNLNALIALLEPFGKSADQVTSAFNSFEVDSKVRAAIKISKQSGATGVPAIVVDGKYLTTQNLPKASPQGVAGMFKTVDLLVEKAASER